MTATAQLDHDKLRAWVASNYSDESKRLVTEGAEATSEDQAKFARALAGGLLSADAPEVHGAPADKRYNALSKKLNDAEASAGAMLAQSFRDDCPHPATARKMAEDYAREANEARAEMKAWRLANGWAK